jgi:hypothetical protein
MPPGDRLGLGLTADAWDFCGDQYIIYVHAAGVEHAIFRRHHLQSDVAVAIHVVGTGGWRLMTRSSKSASDDKAVFERYFLRRLSDTQRSQSTSHHASHRQPSDFGTDRGSIFTCSSSWRTSRNTALWLDNRSRQPYLQIDYCTGLDVTMLLFVTVQLPSEAITGTSDLTT